MRETEPATTPLDGGVEKGQKSPTARSAPSKGRNGKNRGLWVYHPPATVSLPALLHKQSDQQFRRLVQDLLTVSRRLEMARDYFGRRIKCDEPAVQPSHDCCPTPGTTGVSVGSVAQAMHVSSAFVTSETGKLSDVGLIRKRPNA
jgi:hypothetical protein